MEKIKFSNSVLEVVREAAGMEPALESETGKLFAGHDLPVCALKLNIPVQEYLERFVAELPDPSVAIIHEGEPGFDVILRIPVTVSEGKAYSNGQEIRLL